MVGELISQVISEGRRTLNEYESKLILAAYGVPITRECLVASPSALSAAVKEIGFPLVMKACSAAIAHKTERNVIRLNISSLKAASRAYKEIKKAMEDAPGGVLVQEMVPSGRELVVGMTRDVQFGPCVMFGLGGVFTEVFQDVVFRKAPLTEEDALSMTTEIQGVKILGPVRGMEVVNLRSLAAVITAVGRIALEHPSIAEIDINPLIIRRGEPVAVDALMVLGP